MAWFYMQAMGNSTERIMVFDNIWDFDEDMLYDATVTLATTKSKEKNNTVLNLKKLIKSQFKDHLSLYSWANDLYLKVRCKYPFKDFIPLKVCIVRFIFDTFQTIDNPPEPEVEDSDKFEEVELTLVQELEAET